MDMSQVKMKVSNGKLYKFVLPAISSTVLCSLVVACNSGTSPQTPPGPPSNVAYVVNSESNSVSMFSYDRSGMLIPLNTRLIQTESNPVSVVTDHRGKNVYVVNHNSNSISWYAINYGTGKLEASSGSTVKTVKTESAPQQIVIHPSNKFAYVVNDVSNSISMYAIESSGELRPLPESAALSYGSPDAVTIDPDGKYLYTANTYSNKIGMYRIDQKTGKLSPLTVATVAAGTHPIDIKIAKNSKFAYVVNFDSNNVLVYRIESGILTKVSDANTNKQPRSILLAPGGKFAYVTNKGSGNISIYSINQTDGSLTQIGSPVPAQNSPWSITSDVDGNYVYVTNYEQATVSMYALNQDTGSLKPLAKSSVPTAGWHPFEITTVKLRD